jgi:hypothetical protein
MLITDSRINLMIDMKESFYRYFKSMFDLGIRNQLASSEQFHSSVRPNNVSDVAILWLQFLRPWNGLSKFVIEACALNNSEDTMLINSKGKLNKDLYNILCHPNLFSQTNQFKFSYIENDKEREEEIMLWD